MCCEVSPSMLRFVLTITLQAVIVAWDERQVPSSPTHRFGDSRRALAGCFTTVSKKISCVNRIVEFCNFRRKSNLVGLKGGCEVKAIDVQLQDLMDLITAKADLVLEPAGALKPATLTTNLTSSLRAPGRTSKKMAGLLRTTSEELIGLMNTFESRLERLKLWKVKFKRYARVKFGQALFVCGDASTLGDGDPTKAIRMKHMGDNLWEVVVEEIPEGAKFRYLIKSHGDSKASDIQWVTSYPLQLSSRMEDCFLENGMLVQDNTQQAVRFKVSRAGATQVGVVGSIPVLGNWDYSHALRLDNVHGNTWEKMVQIRSDELADFEYKLFADHPPNRIVESGPNRISDAHLVEPQRELDASGELTDLRIVNLQCVWEGLLIRFLIYHPLESPTAYMAVSGSHEAMGGWLGKPLQMGLGNERTLLTNVQGRCWEATFPAGPADVHNVQYRYCIVDPATNSALFEREPNRVIPSIPGSESSSKIDAATLRLGTAARDKAAPYRQREWQTYDGNFVPPNLSFNDVPPCLAIGPYPQSAADVALMKRAGITGVLNVQTDDDHRRRMVDWPAMMDLYKKNDIDVIRVPIEDFNGPSPPPAPS